MCRMWQFFHYKAASMHNLILWPLHSFKRDRRRLFFGVPLLTGPVLTQGSRATVALPHILPFLSIAKSELLGPSCGLGPCGAHSFLLGKSLGPPASVAIYWALQTAVTSQRLRPPTVCGLAL